MFEIEAHYHDRKIYLSDGRVYPLGEILLRYNRAYKQHYARFMKKKMSKAEFAEWGEYAIQLRQKAADGELDIDEYQRLIRV